VEGFARKLSLFILLIHNSRPHPLDRETFWEILGSVVKRYNSLCHAYCLMDNHYHLLGRHSFVQKMKEIPRIERFTIRPIGVKIRGLGVKIKGLVSTFDIKLVCLTHMRKA